MTTTTFSRKKLLKLSSSWANMFLREGASFTDDFYRILEAWQNRTFGLKFLLLFGVALGCHGCCWARGGSLQGPASVLDRLQLILHTADVSPCHLPLTSRQYPLGPL